MNTYIVDVETPRLTITCRDMSILEFRKLMRMDRADEIDWFCDNVLTSVHDIDNDKIYQGKDELDEYFMAEPWRTLTAMHDAWSNHLSSFP